MGKMATHQPSTGAGECKYKAICRYGTYYQEKGLNILQLLPQGSQGLQVVHTRSISTYATRGAHVLQTGAHLLQKAFADVAPAAKMVQSAIAVNVVFISFTP